MAAQLTQPAGEGMADAPIDRWEWSGLHDAYINVPDGDYVLHADYIAERDALLDVLHRSGFVRCDIPACNCGSWHARYGLRERMNEIIRALTDAGVLNNITGNLPINAISHLITDRDRLAARCEGLDRVLPGLVEQMDILRDDFVAYSDGKENRPFVVVRDALIAALNEYDDARKFLSPPASDAADSTHGETK